jgi:hypothetical protein
MTNEELIKKYPNGIVISSEEKITILNKLNNSEQLTTSESEKLYDGINFLENNTQTLNHALSIVKRNLALLQLQLKFSLGLVDVSNKDNDELFLSEVKHIDASIINELNGVLNESDQKGEDNPETNSETTTNSSEQESVEGESVAGGTV